MNINYEINKRKVLDDYYKCVGAFLNCCKLYQQRTNYIITKNNTEEEKLIKKGMQEDLLSNLGKVGEKAFKYIIGLENLNINPNQDENAFESLWKKTTALKDFAQKHGIAQTNPKFIELINYHDDNNQKAHNFHYWFCVMDLMLHSLSKKFEKYMEYTIQSKELIEYCQKRNEYRYVYNFGYEFIDEISLPFRNAIFPHLIEFELEDLPFVPKKDIELIKNNNLEAIKKNGDIFTRLRYASNNTNNLEFNLDEVFELIQNIVTFINLIHYNNDDFNFDLNKSFAKIQALKYKEYLRVSEEEINNLFDLDIIGADLALTIFETNYSYSNIKNLLDIGIPISDLKSVMREGLQARTIKFFFEKGITDYRIMREYLDYYNENGYYPNDINRLIKNRRVSI